jgi:hypothetical protein
LNCRVDCRKKRKIETIGCDLYNPCEVGTPYFAGFCGVSL